VNVSNFQPTPQLTEFGTWIAKCLWFATDPGSWGHTGAGADPNYPQKVGHFEWCASQYYPATSTDYTTWHLTDQWYADNVESQTWVPYPGNAGLTHFVIDSSRNGQGPWSPASGKYSGDPQVWCDPPSRGVGLRPTVNTGNALLDAYLWVKVPGESDGSCTRGTTGTVDPEWGIVDPAAGSWFPAEALQLAQMANPPLL
jgi:endoglucanase